MVDAGNDELGTKYGYGRPSISGTDGVVDVGGGLLHNSTDGRAPIQWNCEIGSELEPGATIIWQVEFHVQVTGRVGYGYQ